jgi:hypothetical protein
VNELREFVPIAVRAWTVPTRDKDAAPGESPDGANGARRRRRRRGRRAPPITHALVIDTETSTDPAQRLLYGAYRYVRIDDTTVTTVAEGLFYADDLPANDPVGYARLVEYALHAKADVDLFYLRVEPDWALRALSGRSFAEQILHRIGYRKRGPREPALTVMFNAPFDWSRLAVDAAEARDDLYGGFSFTVWTGRDGTEAAFRPRVAIKSIDAKRALKKFRRVERGAWDTAGHLLDLRTLVFALTGQSHSLQSACDAFGVQGKAAAPEFGTITADAIDYCRRDVAATSELLEAVLTEYAEHPIDLQPTQAYSPASIAKAYLRGMGIQPRLAAQPDFAPELLGHAMAAFYGGRAEVHIRKTRMPIALLDVTSMYPTVDTLMNVWPLITAERVEAVDATAEVQELLAGITPDACFRRGLWPQFLGLAQVIPDGDLLPVRANYGPDPDTVAWSIGLNDFHDDRAYWYAIPDLVTSAIRTGRAPKVLRAVRFVAVGTQATLRPIQVRGQQPIDPAREDFFRRVVETRQQLKTDTVDHPGDCQCDACRTHPFLKVLGNSGTYGIFAEIVRRELPVGTRLPVTVYGPHDEPFVARVSALEDPGEYCFPPVAACITAAARLLLALIEHEVTRRGGSWVFCDTDSLAVVATETGGLITCEGGAHRDRDGHPAVRALSRPEVEEIRAAINQLNPYHRDLVPELLKQELTGDCYAISAKRYVITAPDGRILKRSLHGLGRLLDPRSPDEPRRDRDGNPIWIDEAWQWILDADRDPDAPLPDWAQLPAMSRITVSSTNLWRPFARHNRRRGWAEQIKPFNFLLVPTIDPFGYPPGADPARFRLIGPYESDPRRWTQRRWRNLYDQDRNLYRITTDANQPAAPDLVLVRSYRDVLAEYRGHPEHKFDAPDGGRVRPDTRGELQRRTVRSDGRLHLIGKEANKIDDVQSGVIADPDEVITDYSTGTPSAAWLRDYVLPVLARYPGRQLAALVGANRRSIDRIRRGAQPRPALAAALTQLAARVAADDLHLPTRDRRNVAPLLAAWRSQYPRDHRTGPGL